MHPIHDMDALLLLAVAVASKRRAAELSEVVAAAELIHGAIPAAPKLAAAFSRMSEHGLLCEADGRFTLTGAAQTIVTGLPRKIDAEERVFALKQKLRSYDGTEQHPRVDIGETQMTDAIEAHRATGQGTGKNMMMPKPKPSEEQGRRPAGARKPFFRGRRD